jgi:hypothetical protein
LHEKPQLPQLPLLKFRFTSQPVDGSPSQLAKLGLQSPSPQTPSWQIGEAFLGSAQTVVQPPQWVTSDRRSVSQPSRGLPLQSPKPGLHESAWQDPAMHAPRPASPAQLTVHEPQ